MKVTKSQMLEMLKKMLEIRHFEEKVVDQYARGGGPGACPSLYRGRGGCRRDVQQSDRRRLHHEHPSGPWTLHCQRGRVEADDG